MKENIIPELFEEPVKSLQKHLELEDNHRILFSGIYGIGKTTFLKHFFKDSEFAQQYNVFHLFPINYSIMTTEDIMQYIKYDILAELIFTHKVPVESEKLAFLKTLPSFYATNALSILSTFILLIPKLGKQLFEFKEEWAKIVRQTKEYQKEQSKDEFDELNEFVQSIHKQSGGLYEMDAVTDIIANMLEYLARPQEDNKEQKSDKQNILIIDDLDRLDPHHVFRLFNIFAAHFDNPHDKEYENKFGFDKVIFVCDVKNIRHLFRHNYGAKVDFNGYIDKFYSKRIYNFSNKNGLLQIINKVILNTTYTSDDNYIRHTFYEFGQKSGLLFQNVAFIFSQFIQYNQINLRVFIKWYEKKIHVEKREIVWSKRNYMWNNDYDIILAIDILLEYFGQVEQLKEKCQFIADLNLNVDFSNYQVLIGSMIGFLDDKNRHKETYNSEEDMVYYKVKSLNNIEISYIKGNRSPYNCSNWGRIIKIGGFKINDDVRLTVSDFFKVFLEVIELLEKRSYIN